MQCNATSSSARRGNEEAKALLKSALRVREQSLGANHLDTADTLLKLGGLYREQGLAEEAELLYRCVCVYKRVFHEYIGTHAHSICCINSVKVCT